MPIQLLAVFGALLFLSGCATIMNDPTVPIQIHASEKDTQVKANGHWYNTPATVSFLRGQGNQPLVFRKPGQNDTTVFLKEDADSAEWGNVFWPFIGLIFMGIDYSNGKGYTLYPERVHFSFFSPTGIFDPEKNSAPVAAATPFDGP